jgi:hypothetical protein
VRLRKFMPKFVYIDRYNEQFVIVINKLISSEELLNKILFEKLIVTQLVKYM